MRLKSIILAGMSAAGLLLLASACEKEPAPAPDGPGEPGYTVLSSIRVSAESAGFRFAESQETYGFGFTTGDRIGLYAVLDGETVAENLCYEYFAERDMWRCVSEFDGNFYAEAEYYAYYPYSADNTWAASLSEDAPADKAHAFFSELISGWSTPADQSEEDSFRSACLMTGYAASLTGNSAAFTMEPAVAIAAVELPKELYRFTNTDVAVPDYVMNEWSDAEFSGAQLPCYDGDGRFVYAVMPEGEWSASVAYLAGGENESWSGPVSGAGAGTCSVAKVDGGLDITEHLLQPGDFYLADGSLLPKDAPEDEVEAASVIGVVYQIDPERFDPALKDLLGEVHGIVLSTKEPLVPAAQEERLKNTVLWCSSSASSRDESNIGFKNIDAVTLEATFNMADDDIRGYYYNTLIRTRRADDMAAGIYPVFQAALDFAETTGGPLESAPVNTGWYLPANGEWFDILRNLCGADLVLDEDFMPELLQQVTWGNQGEVMSALNETMSKVSYDNKDLYEPGGAWWTSSVAGTGAARYVGFNDLGYIHSHWQKKDTSLKARMVLAF